MMTLLICCRSEEDSEGAQGNDREEGGRLGARGGLHLWLSPQGRHARPSVGPGRREGHVQVGQGMGQGTGQGVGQGVVGQGVIGWG